MGQIIDENGRRPDPTRSKAIMNMPAPTNVASLQSFLGLANYYSNNIPSMYTLRGPLNKLLRKEVKWSWSVDCQQVFENLKTALTSGLNLTHYDPNKDLRGK